MTKLWRTLLFITAVSIFLLPQDSRGGTSESPRLTLGILPTFSTGGDPFADAFDQHLSVKLFEQFQGSIAHPVLLNPGGLYRPEDNDWLLDYGKTTGVDALLITTLLKAEAPEKGNWTIIVQGEILDLRSGTRCTPWKSISAISRRDLSPYLNYGALDRQLYGFDLNARRAFEKQPLGKAMNQIAEQICTQTLQNVQTMPTAASASNLRASAAACDVHAKVLYVSKHAVSKTYTVFADGKDESLNVSDGEVTFHGKSGTLLLQLAVNDAPYKLPKQELYQASSDVDCSKPQLSFNIGAAGEGWIVWK